MAHVTFPKPAKGSHWLAGRERRATRKAAEDAIMRSVRVRDGHQCRWPSCEFAPNTGQRDIQPLTSRGTDGPCCFYTRSESGRWDHVWTEQGER